MEYEFKGKNTNNKRENMNSKAPMEFRPYKKDRYEKSKSFEDMLSEFLTESKDKQKHVKTEFIKERKNKKIKDKDIGDDK